MSLLCHETGRDIEFGDLLMAGTRGDLELYCALDREALEKIPESEKRFQPCVPGEGGVDVHHASSSLNLGGSYTWSGFRLGIFSFSVSRETAEKYLPKTLQDLDSYYASKKGE